MVSVALAGQVSEVCPLGLARPSRRRAVDVPPSWPANHISSTLLTLLRQGVSTGFAVLSTTTVFGLAAATALMRLVLSADSEIGAEMVPVPYGLGMLEVAPTPSLTKTSASFLPTAAAAASVMSPFVRE